VREFVQGGDDNEAGRWIESVNKSSLPQAVADIVSALTNEGSGIRKRKYRLEAVLSIVRDDMDRASPEVLKLVESGATGHLVLHTRVRNEVRVSMLEEQIKQLEALLDIGSSEYSLLGAIDSSWRERLDAARERLAVLQREGSDDEWILVNGFVVSNTIVEDATAFHVRFKEPSLVVYRALDADEPGAPTPVQIDTTVLPVQVMRTVSLTDGTRSILAANQVDSELPGRGDLVAFDAEFVSVQEEEASLTETGSKVVVRETRYAVGRVSVMDCRARRVIVDDYVLPREPVVDYLTRFSGIVPKDLDPKQSARHLVTTRDAYRKLRHLIERGCVFVGHGLLQGTS
jgi:PAB-dependent poly(A)-specific ribonuclease subunit 2